MDLYFLKFNNYYNRTIKFYNSVNGYQQNGEFLGEPLLGCSFNPNDSTDTIHVVNRAQEEIGDYMLAVLGNEIISRWFILEARRERTGQYTLMLRRDLFADSYTDVIQAPAFIEKATLDSGDPMIFNKEDMTFNQIKTSETPLKDETNSAWVVGYIPRDSFAEAKQIQGSVNIGEAYDIEVTSLADWDYYSYINQKFKGYYNTSETLYAGYVRMVPKVAQLELPYMQGFSIQANGVIDIYDVNTYVPDDPNNGKVNGISSPSLTDLYLNFNPKYPATEAESKANSVVSIAPQGWRTNISTINSQSLAYTGCNTATDDYNYRQLKNKIIFDSGSGLYHRIIITQEKKTGTLNITSGNLLDTLNSNITRTIGSAGTISGNGGSDSFKMYYSYYEYTMTLEQVYITATTTINSDRYHLEDQPYDMFCIPYSDTLEIYKNGTKLFNANKSIAINMSIEIGADAGTNSIYDVQLLPYCPVRYCIKSDGTFDIGDAKVHYIKNNNDENIGVILWAISSAFTLNIPHTIEVLNPKIESQTDIYRLSSPNFNGQFEFSPAINGGVNYFNVDCNYKPFNPYIHINPNFNYLYGQDFNDARGLICGGDFSLPQLSNAWSNYQLNNKNYQNIFDRQIENMEVNNAIQRKKETLGVGLGMIGGLAGGAMAGAKGGLVGMTAGAVIGGIGSAVAGGMDMMLNERSRIEALDYTKDQFGYNLGNIQAIPTSLSKTSAFTYNNKIFPILEFYTCTEEEKRALENKLKYNGMTVMRIGTIQEFIKETPTYIKGKLIRLENTGEDFHYVSELAKEFDKGVFI
jgi:hypothetical protein